MAETSLAQKFLSAAQYLKYIDPGTYFGMAAKALAKGDISQTSLALLEQRGGLNEPVIQSPADIANPGNIATSIVESAGNAMTQAMGGGSQFVAVAGPNPMGMVVAFGKEGGEIQSAHKQLIEDCAKKGIPGYMHDTVEINGRSVELWVDATNINDGESSGMRYASMDIRNPRMMRRHEPETEMQIKLAAALDRLESKAIDGLHNYNQSEPLVQYVSRMLSNNDGNQATAVVTTDMVAKKAMGLTAGPGG